MKIRIISLTLALLFISILTFEYISSTIVLESKPIKTIEYVFEKRIIDKYIDDDFVLSHLTITLQQKTYHSHTVEETFYNYLHLSSILRPPIQA